jgi:hypothetical protein
MADACQQLIISLLSLHAASPGDEQQYQALLSDYFWGVNAVVVNAILFRSTYLAFGTPGNW